MRTTEQHSEDDSDSELDEEESEEETEDDDEEEEEDDRPREPGILDELPDGWYRGGSHPGKYKMGLDERVYRSGSASAIIQSIAPDVTQGERVAFGTICQSFFPKDYLSKRIRLTAFLRYDLLDDTISWAGIWMKTEFPSSQIGVNLFRLDNMSDRKLQGSSKGEWFKVSIVNDIPMSAVNCTFGFLLCGGGFVWADDFQFEVVDKSTPLTGVPKQKKPINLNFQTSEKQSGEGVEGKEGDNSAPNSSVSVSALPTLPNL